MSFIQWIHSFFQTQRPTSSHLHLVNQSQPLRDMQTYSPVEQIRARTFGDEEMEETFQKMLARVGGRDNILLVGEAGHGPENDGGSSGLLQELALALFESSTKTSPWEKSEGDGGNAESGCLKSHTDSKSRVLQFPVILIIFRDTLIMEPANSTFIREVLRDVKLRADGHTKAMVGIIYSRDRLGEDTSVESHNRLGHIMGQVFKGQSWGVCSYCQSRPQTILQVKRTILETVEMEDKGRSKQDIRDPGGDLQRHFKDLVNHLGGKERFLLVGNICPSARPSKRAMVFKELSRALFEEDAKLPVTSCGNDEEIVTSEKENRPTGYCTKLPKPKPFPYSLILMVFRHSFLLEDIKLKQVKEILADVKSRLKRRGALVVGVVCSAQGLEEEEYLRCKSLLHKMLHHNFGGKIGVCQYVRARPESLEEVKRSICDVVRET